ncbi:mediator of RNA polymerase II transcription subunit 8 [Neocucurbitaria cava]|uniref:Mediator of RNA polymerase II transcription subunit 8 n=1 Tax=Neocucurbitaria cava TaxID=798079 RepID=A0A9W8YCS2_9PLEO|nr:mediator of RNA polymerase II transcription subunit 8 [Neocucurbitaria cava]
MNVVMNQISSFSTLMNGGYKHSSESTQETRQVPKHDDNGNPVLNPDGTPVLVSKDLPKTIYRDTPFNGQADRIQALHPFPMAPFPITGIGANMATTMLRKRLEPKEEEWVEERLRKASEFAHVPSEWGIEPRKPGAKDEKANDGDDSDVDDDSAERMPTKRVKGTLSEDEILDLWQHAHQEAFDQQYLRSKYPEEYGEDAGAADEGETPDAEDEEEDDDDDDEEDFEDVMDTTDAPDTGKALEKPGDTPAPEATATGVRPMVPAKPAVHQPVPGLPVLPLGFMHKLMTNGDARG